MTTEDGGPGAKGSAVRHEVEAPRIEDELYQAFPNVPTPIGVDPVDGLPKHVVPTAWKDAQAPNLDPEKFVCMADCSKFVIRNPATGDISHTFPASQVTRNPAGRWVLSGEGKEGIEAFLWPDVAPVRPQCGHYKRQLIPFPEDPEHKMVVRLCTARRTDEGEFLSLGNAAMLACELRNPPYGNRVDDLDAFDQQIIDAVKDKVVADDFDLDAALSAQTPPKKD